MKYFLSPEFQRQIWLRFDPLRVVAAPVLLGLCSMVAMNLGGGSHWRLDMAHEGYLCVRIWMLVIYFFVVLVWGTLEASSAMVAEMRANTWDFQCMSSISPAQLALGKLFGATSYTWYFGLQALVVFSVAYLFDPGSQWSPKEPLEDLPVMLAGFVLAGLLGQSLAFLNYLAELSSALGRTTRSLLPGGMGAFLIGLAVGAYAFFLVASGAGHMTSEYSRVYRAGIDWYWQSYDFPPFLICSMAFFVAWFIIGGYRLVRTELMYRNQPLVWMLFVASVIAWDSGFSLHSPVSPHVNMYQRWPSAPAPETSTAEVIFRAFLQVAMITYGAMLNEAADLRKYARLAFFAQARDIRRVLENLPKWVVTAPFVILTYVAVAAASLGAGNAEEVLRLTTFMSALILFMARDGLVLHSIHGLSRGRGGRFAIIFYYVLAYVLLPLGALTMERSDVGRLLNSLSDLEKSQGLGHIVAFFFPIVIDPPAFSILPPFAEALLAAVGFHYVLSRRASNVIANPKA